MKNSENNKDIRLFEQQVKELSDEQLDSVAGGGGIYNPCPPYCNFNLVTNRCECEDEQ